MLGTLLVAMLTSTPRVGDVAPDFAVKDIDGNELQLSKLSDDGPVIVAFFIKAFTGG